MPTDSERNAIEAHFEEVKADFQHALHIAIEAKNAAEGTKTDRRGELADTLLLRNILTGMTIFQALHPSSVNQFPKLISPDFASIAVLARTILETSLAMFSISIQQYPKGETELRLLWWDWHELNEKIRALQIIRSKRPEIKVLEERRAALGKRIDGHTSFEAMPKQLRKDFKKGEPPRQALWESNGAIAVDSGILREHFNVQYQFLSAAAHSQPMIVSVLRKHDPHALEAKGMINEALNFATAYLAFSVCGFSQLCPAATNVFDSRFTKIAKVWVGVFAKPFPED